MYRQNKVQFRDACKRDNKGDICRKDVKEIRIMVNNLAAAELFDNYGNQYSGFD